MRRLYADSLTALADGRYKFSPCCFGLFFAFHLEADQSILLTCSTCGRQSYKVHIQPPFTLLRFERRVAFSIQDGKFVMQLVPEFDTEEFWYEFHTGHKQLVRLLPRELEGCAWWQALELTREVVGLTVNWVARLYRTRASSTDCGSTTPPVEPESG